MSTQDSIAKSNENWAKIPGTCRDRPRKVGNKDHDTSIKLSPRKKISNIGKDEKQFRLS